MRVLYSLFLVFVSCRFKSVGSRFFILFCLFVNVVSANEVTEGNDDVLQMMEQGFSAFHHRDYQLAERLFDKTLLNIESVYADNESARKARSLWYSEDNKAFKGEPYERSMAYYYRGLLYLYDAQYDNARASFLGGLLQDAFAEEAQNRSDFASLMFLSSWAARLMGSAYLQQEGFDELLRYRPDFPLPAKSHNTLVIVETGAGPRKLADGIGHYELVYRRGKGLEGTKAKLSRGNNLTDLYPIEDVFWQASTRGGRQVDRIIKGKAVFKSTNASIGSGLSEVANNAVVLSSAFENSREISAVAGAFSLLGVAQMAMASNVNARADTRYWSSLPAMINVLTLHLKPEIKTLKFQFFDDFDDPVIELEQEVKVVWDKKGNALVWLRLE